MEHQPQLAQASRLCQIPDHPDNVRLTFTTAAGGTTSSYMETENAGYEETTFENIESTRQVDQLYNHTEDGNTSARLNAAEGKAMGLYLQRTTIFRKPT